MLDINHSHVATFRNYFYNLPEIQQHVDAGVDIFESFVDKEGVHHFCWSRTRDDFKEWLLANPIEDRDIREEFVNDIVNMSKERRDITLYNHFAQFDKNEPRRNPAAEALYMKGVSDAISNIISMTNDNNPSGTKWRLTTTEGDVLPFCNPKDKEYLETPGLIALFHNAISS